jgi:hypothetical protein
MPKIGSKYSQKRNIGAEAAQFPEKEYINGIAFAMCTSKTNNNFVRLYFYSRTLLTKMNIAVRAFQVWSDDFSLKIKQEIKIKYTAESIVLVVY